VSDKESFNTARRLAREEGLLVGGSSGTAVAAALKYARQLKKPKYMVVLLPDTGRNYLTKMYSDAWMQENGFWEGKEIKITKVKEVLNQKKDLPPMISVDSQDILSKAVKLMHGYNISQLPVVDHGKIVGSLQEASLMKLLHDGVDFTKQGIFAVMGKPLPALDEDTEVSEVYRLLLSGTTGIIVTRDDVPIGVITRADLVNHWMAQKET